MKPIFDVAVIQRALHSPTQWCVILIGIFVTMSVALDNLMLALILLAIIGAVTQVGSGTNGLFSSYTTTAAAIGS